jgi:peptidyl-prolyl cis-trans isomerase SurA
MKRILLGLFVGCFSLLTVSAHAETLDKIAAIVNDQVVTENELTAEIDLLKHRLSQKKMTLPAKAVLRKQVLDHLIDVDLQLQIAKRNNIMVEPTQVDDAIKTIAQRNKITPAALKQSIEAQGLAWKKYKANVKKEILLSRVQQGAVGQIVVSDAEVDVFLKANKEDNNTLYHLKDLVVSLPEAPSPEVLKKAKVKADALIKSLRDGLNFSEAALSKSSGEFAFKGGDLGYRPLAGLPEMFAKRVIAMKVNDIVGPIRAPNGFHIIKLIEKKNDKTKKTVVLTRARQILLKVEPGMDASEVKKRLETLALQIKRGQSFNTIAKRFSDDKRSAKKGGELGWVHKGELPSDFEKAMDKLKPGQVSVPIKTDSGWHLIKVEARKDIDDSKAYRRERVKQELYQRRFYEAVQNWLQQLKANSYVKLF